MRAHISKHCELEIVTFDAGAGSRQIGARATRELHAQVRAQLRKCVQSVRAQLQNSGHSQELHAHSGHSSEQVSSLVWLSA